MKEERIIRQSKNFFILNCKGTNYSGNYQILEITQDYPCGLTIAEHQNKRDCLKQFKQLVNH